jgi:hypothetical protein
MNSERVMHTANDVKDVLGRVSFAPSCVDMGWKWEVKTAYSEHGHISGWLIRTTFRRPDRDTGEVEEGFGRWWHVPVGVTESGVVKTAFAAAKLILEHELMESFRVDGVRIFDPHHTIADLRMAAVHHTGGVR